MIQRRAIVQSGSGAPPANAAARNTGRTDAAATVATVVRRGVLGATRGKMTIQTQDQDMPRPHMAVTPSHQPRFHHRIYISMPIAPMTSNTSPSVMMRAGAMVVTLVSPNIPSDTAMRASDVISKGRASAECSGDVGSSR